VNGLARGQVWNVDLPDAGQRPFVIVTRDSALAHLRTVTVVEVTSTRSGAPTEVAIQPSPQLRLDGESYVRCDNIATIDQQELRSLRGVVASDELFDIGTALSIAFDLV
jgi:mRNA-degrading endonuclease toxin of MazEF toxin-antitoxin module